VITLRKAKTLLTLAILAFPLYLVSWTLAFILVQTRAIGGNGVDFAYYLPYLKGFWTGRTGEGAFFVGACSILVFVGFTIVIFPRAYRRLSGGK
jgi:hypothetical protein